MTAEIYKTPTVIVTVAKTVLPYHMPTLAFRLSISITMSPLGASSGLRVIAHKSVLRHYVGSIRW